MKILTNIAKSKVMKRLYYRLRNWWWNFKRGVKNIFLYMPLMFRLTDWDSQSYIEFINFYTKRLYKYISTAKREIDETRIPKENDMLRLIELTQNYLDNTNAIKTYWERAGYDFKATKFNFVPSEMGEEWYEMEEEVIDEEAYKKNEQALKDGRDLEEKEWKEIIELLSKLRVWWD